MSGYTAVIVDLPEDDGSVTIYKVQVAQAESLSFLQGSVGGYIEHVASEDGKIDFWMNEEGKLNGLPVNDVASELLYLLYPAFRGHDFLVGKVVLTSNTPDGDTASIPPDFWDQLQVLPWTINVKFVELEETSDSPT